VLLFVRIVDGTTQAAYASTGASACEVFTLTVISRVRPFGPLTTAGGGVKFHRMRGSTTFDFMCIGRIQISQGRSHHGQGASAEPEDRGVHDRPARATTTFRGRVCDSHLSRAPQLLLTPAVPSTPPTVTSPPGFSVLPGQPRHLHVAFRTQHPMNPLKPREPGGRVQACTSTTGHYLFRIGMYSSFDGGQT